MKLDKNKVPFDESSSRVAESTNNTTTNDSSIAIVRIAVIEGIPETLEESKLSFKGSEDASSSIGPEIEAPPLKREKLGTT